MSARKLVIDTDPGIDDAMAVVFASLRPEIDLIGLTSVFGNVSGETAARNALWLAELVGGDIPVARGSDVPLVQAPLPFAREFHGDEGFGYLPACSPRGQVVPESAAEFLASAARAHPGELDVCAVGPLTNIANALVSSPEFRELRSLTVMGGSLDAGGNATEFAEANIWQDPHAADIVFSFDWDVTIVGLDVTQQVVCTPEEFSGLREQAPRLGGFLDDATRFYFDITAKTCGIQGCHMHDPTAVISLVRPDLFVTRSHPVGVTLDGPRAGETAWYKGEPERQSVQVCTGVEVDEVRRCFLQTIATGF